MYGVCVGLSRRTSARFVFARGSVNALTLSFVIALLGCPPANESVGPAPHDERVDASPELTEAGNCQPLSFADASLRTWRDAMQTLCIDDGEWPREVSGYSCPGHSVIVLARADTVDTHFYRSRPAS